MKIIILLVCFVGIVYAAKTSDRNGFVIVKGDVMKCSPKEEEKYCKSKCQEQGGKDGVCCEEACYCYQVPKGKDIYSDKEIKQTCEKLGKKLGK
ncbi:toxin Aah6-like [Centruroides sculpturatus]|uniref:toxin Aah6-like n=1 Tax=Centruroides sculpturatus TaxID=218467 RepID=UPI000C6E38F4|nr:toxin Aah6-like [Centruroides sculpturatus]